MSRIGNKSIELPKGVSLNIKSDNTVVVAGPKGTLEQSIDRDISVVVDNNLVKLGRPSNQIRHKALHGLYRALVANLVKGVSDGYKIDLELVGVGYKATNDKNVLDLSLGFSHNILFVIPKELSVKTLTEKGKNPLITLEGIDKQLIGQVAAKLRSIRKPEPYKGKGVKYVNEVLRRKAGKAAGK